MFIFFCGQQGSLGKGLDLNQCCFKFVIKFILNVLEFSNNRAEVSYRAKFDLFESMLCLLLVDRMMPIEPIKKSMKVTWVTPSMYDTME